MKKLIVSGKVNRAMKLLKYISTWICDLCVFWILSIWCKIWYL